MSPRRDACLSGVAAGLEPALEWAWIHVQQVQPELGAPPQNVLRGARKLLAAQVLDLALVQVRQQLPTQVRERAGRAEHALEARAIRMGTATKWLAGKPSLCGGPGAAFCKSPAPGATSSKTCVSLSTRTSVIG